MTKFSPAFLAEPVGVAAGPSSSSHQNGAVPVTGLSQADQQVFLDQSSDDDDDVEDDDIDDAELDALESSIKHKA